LNEYNWWYGKMKLGETLTINDIAKLPPAAAPEKAIFSQQSIQSIANIPVFMNERLAGSLGFDAVKQRIVWSKEIIILLEVVAGIISNALDRQQHEIYLSESRAQHLRRSEELGALRDTIADITAELEIDKLLQTILERSIKLLNADGGDFCVFEAEENMLKVVAVKNLHRKFLHTHLRLGEGAAGKAAVMRETLILDDYSSWEGKLGEYEQASIRSAMVSPLVFGDRLLGTVGMFNFSPEKRFSEDDQKLLSMFAQHASIALDNAMLFEKIHELARIDEVTGLLNRRSFFERAEYEINRARRLNQSLALAMIDLDGFKHVNDQYSHQVGDQVLHDISKLFIDNIRNMDIIGRYGGDETILLMPETSKEHALLVLDRLQTLLAEHEFTSGQNKIHISASIGLAYFVKADSSLEEMISIADEAMYRAKKHGKNRISQ
jgi:diguanylate cyclase (GGDEF)-like protein